MEKNGNSLRSKSEKAIKDIGQYFNFIEVLKMFVVVSYDIFDDKRRNKIRKTLEDYGLPSQLSLFECELDEKSLSTLKVKLEKIGDNREDKIKIYHLCKTCKNSIESLCVNTQVGIPQLLMF